jgi:hypothetical protein
LIDARWYNIDPTVTFKLAGSSPSALATMVGAEALRTTSQTRAQKKWRQTEVRRHSFLV